MDTKRYCFTLLLLIMCFAPSLQTSKVQEHVDKVMEILSPLLNLKDVAKTGLSIKQIETFGSRLQITRNMVALKESENLEKLNGIIYDFLSTVVNSEKFTHFDSEGVISDGLNSLGKDIKKSIKEVRVKEFTDRLRDVLMYLSENGEKAGVYDAAEEIKSWLESIKENETLGNAARIITDCLLPIAKREEFKISNRAESIEIFKLNEAIKGYITIEEEEQYALKLKEILGNLIKHGAEAKLKKEEIKSLKQELISLEMNEGLQNVKRIAENVLLPIAKKDSFKRFDQTSKINGKIAEIKDYINNKKEGEFVADLKEILRQLQNYLQQGSNVGRDRVQVERWLESLEGSGSFSEAIRVINHFLSTNAKTNASQKFDHFQDIFAKICLLNGQIQRYLNSRNGKLQDQKNIETPFLLQCPLGAYGEFNEEREW